MILKKGILYEEVSIQWAQELVAVMEKFEAMSGL
jgi:hypothetical protein